MRNTVVISLKEYNSLRDFKKEAEDALKNQEYVVIEHKWSGYTTETYRKRMYYTDKEIVSDFAKTNKELNKEIKDLQSENKLLKEKNKKLDDDNYKVHADKVALKVKIIKLTDRIETIKEMSIMQFLKWKKSKS